MLRKRKKYPNVFNTEQLVKLFDCIDKPKVMIATFVSFFCGLRIDEICNLRVKDIDLTIRRLKIIDSKFGKDRYVPIPPQVIPVIRLWLEILGDKEWLLESSQQNAKHITKKTLYQQYYKYLEMANLRELDFYDKKGRPRYKYYFHTLRHSYATFLLERGVKIEHISKSLGHARLDTTQIYAHISDVELQKRIDDAFNHPSLQNYQKVDSSFTMPKPEIKPKTELKQDPLTILKIRLANGEINPEEYQKRLTILSPTQPYIG